MCSFLFLSKLFQLYELYELQTNMEKELDEARASKADFQSQLEALRTSSTLDKVVILYSANIGLYIYIYIED